MHANRFRDTGHLAVDQLAEQQQLVRTVERGQHRAVEERRGVDDDDVVRLAGNLEQQLGPVRPQALRIRQHAPPQPRLPVAVVQAEHVAGDRLDRRAVVARIVRVEETRGDGGWTIESFTPAPGFVAAVVTQGCA